MNPHLQFVLDQHRQAVDGFLTSQHETLTALAHAMALALNSGHKILLCGNGGSACDAMHIAGEFVGRFIEDRPSLAALALTADSGILTAVANDYAYDQVFSRQVEGLGLPGDVLIGLSTSGSSPNVLRALERGKEKGLITALFAGEKALGRPAIAEFTLIVPSRITAHIQEAHMVALHALVGLVEQF